jgi:hypothetical protein
MFYGADSSPFPWIPNRPANRHEYAIDVAHRIGNDKPNNQNNQGSTDP